LKRHTTEGEATRHSGDWLTPICLMWSPFGWRGYPGGSCIAAGTQLVCPSRLSLWFTIWCMGPSCHYNSTCKYTPGRIM